jgi:cytosine/adenosine deaminase-related metal-dependent hydrolase
MPDQMGELVCFNDAIILAGDDFQVVHNQSLLVQDGRIISIGQPVESAQQVSLNNKLLCPMFVDAHIHIGDTGAKELGVGLPLEKVVIPPDGLKHRFLQSVSGTEMHINMMRDGLLELLHNGIIAMADFREQGLPGVRALRQAAADLPLHVIALGRMEESGSEKQVEAEAQALLQEADGLGIRDVECHSNEVMKRLRNKFPEKIFAAHSSENITSEMNSRHQTGRGQTARLLEWQPDFLVHLVHAHPEELAQMAEAGVIAVSCPRCNGVLGDGQPNLSSWSRLGLHFALGTDNVLFNSPDMMREMDFASRMVRGLEHNPAAIEPLQLLQAATIDGARALRLDSVLGSLSPGKDASFIAFDLCSPNLKYQQNAISVIVHRATPADIAGVYIKGTRIPDIKQ